MAKDWSQDEVIKELERVLEKQDKEIERLREELIKSYQRSVKTVNDLVTQRQDMANEIERLQKALKQIEYLDRPQIRGLPRRVSIQDIALAALKEVE